MIESLSSLLPTPPPFHPSRSSHSSKLEMGDLWGTIQRRKTRDSHAVFTHPLEVINKGSQL